jgi:hypothetical protein
MGIHLDTGISNSCLFIGVGTHVVSFLLGFDNVSELLEVVIHQILLYDINVFTLLHSFEFFSAASNDLVSNLSHE